MFSEIQINALAMIKSSNFMKSIYAAIKIRYTVHNKWRDFMVKEEVRNLSFLFTETGFVLDTVDREQQDSKWFQRFQED